MNRSGHRGWVASGPISPKGLVLSYFSDLRAWVARMATGYAVAASLFIASAVCLVAATTVAIAALFHWIETSYGPYYAYGAVGGGLLSAGVICALLGQRFLNRPVPPVPRAERQLITLKRAVIVPAVERLTDHRSRAPIDPVTAILAGVAAATFFGWIAVSRTRNFDDAEQGE